MKNFVRGSNVHISVTFFDEDGDVIQPAAANVTISYVPKNNTTQGALRTFITYALVAPTSPATDWTYDWDSSVSEPGVVDCNAVTTDTPAAAVDFQFRLTANRANRELAGDDVPNDFYT